MFVRPLSTAAALAALALLSACVVAPPPQRVVYAAPPQPVYVAPQPVVRPVPVLAEYGRVENIGYVQIAQRPSGAGAILGAVIGGVVGNTIGHGGGRAVATGVGVIGGAVAGNAIEGRTLRDGEIYRVQIRFDNGAMRDFDFQRIDDLRVGDRVKFEGGQIHRI